MVMVLVLNCNVAFAKSNRQDEKQVIKEFNQNKPSEKVGAEGTLYINNIPVYKDISEVPCKKPTTVEVGKNSINSIVNPADGSIEPIDQWFSPASNGTSYYYTSYNQDQYNVLNYKPDCFTLETTSKTNISISGSTEFNFEDVAKLNLSMAIGAEWGKTFTMDFYASSVDYYTSYFLKSACKVKKMEWKYNHAWRDIWGNHYITTYYAYTHDRFGNEYWTWSAPYNQ